MRQGNNNLRRHEDDQLLAELINGQPAAWKQFHLQYDRLIYRCIRKVIVGFSSVIRNEDEREIYANLMVQLLSKDKRKLRSFDTSRGCRLSSWLGLLATNAAYDFLRSLRREVPRVPLSEADSTCDTSASPFEQVDRRQRSHLVQRLVGTMSVKDQLFVRLYFGRGLSPSAVAHVMNISVKTVYSKKHKIQHRLEGIVAAQLQAA